MNRNWIVRKGAPSVRVDERSNTVFITAVRRVSISTGDELVLMNEKYVFTHTANVIEVIPPRGTAPPSSERRTTEIRHSGWRPLEPAVEFDLFTSSLKFLTNRERPSLHLRLGYRSLPDEDLQTIHEGEPFLAREAYLVLLGALPESMRRKFIAEQLLAQGTSGASSFEQRARSLLRFIDTRILSLGKMLVALDEEWEKVRKLADVSDNVEPVFSSENQDYVPDSIRVQASRFRQVQHLITAGQESRTLLEVTSEALRSEEQRARIERFEKIFSGTSS